MNESKHVLGSDFARVDAHALSEADYADVPELDAEWFAKAQPHVDGQPARRGRPKLEAPKLQVNIRLSRQVVDRFRASGRGWQTRIDEALAEWLADHPDVGA